MRCAPFYPLVLVCAVAACSDSFTDPSSNRLISPPTLAAGSPASFTAVYDVATCQNGPGIVNCNIYENKEDVALNAGPDGAALDDGTYFFAVLAPSGQSDPNDGSPNLLSTDPYTDRDFTVASGIVNYPGPHDVDSDGDIQLIPYLNTTNPGGVYILAICELTNGQPVDPSACKYDAFKVNNSD